MTQNPRILREDQARTVAAIQQALVENDSVLATAPTGAGKCHPAGTLILLHDGSVRDVMHIKSGDRLMGPDSRPRTVLTTTPGYGPIVKITPHAGEPWRCNTHHVLTLVRTRNRNPSLRAGDQPTDLTDISVDDYLKRSQRWRHIHQLIKSGPLQFEEPDSAHQLRTMPPYVLGVLLGHHDLAHRTTPAEATNREIVAQLEPYNSSAGLHRHPPTHRPTRVFSKWPNDTTDACQPAINRHCAGDQFIPQPYRTAPQADRLELLAGLIDTNGRTDESGYEYASKSQRLAQDVTFVARSLGMTAQTSPQVNDRGTYWRVSITGPVHTIPSRVPEQRAPLRRQQNDPLHSGFTITPDGRAKYYGFTLDGDGRYLLGNFTITHNTVMFSDIIRRARQRDLRCDVIVHREELLKQSVNAIRIQTGEEPGVVWRHRQEWDSPIRVITHGTLQSRTELPPGAHRPSILTLDEAHHAAAPGWIHAIRLLAPRWLIGFTATPFRHDRHPLVPTPFAATIRLITPADLIKAGHLVPPIVVSPLLSDEHGQPQQIGRAANLPGIYLQAVRHALARDRSKIILYVSGTPSSTPSAVSIQTRDLLHRHGIPAAVIQERSSSRHREQAQAAFQSRTTAVLINYMTLTEGFDATDIDCVILGRNTRSESMLIQMIGRGLRTHPGKQDCLILDFTGRDDVHDVINYWRLDDRDQPQPGPDSETRPREPTEQDLDRLQTAFPDLVSAMDQHRALYPWLAPYHNRRLRTLRLWQPDVRSAPSDYLCVEPTPRQRWKIWKVRVAGQSKPRVSRVAQFGLSSPDAASTVLEHIGDLSHVLRRDAPWRKQPATDAQRRRWHTVHAAPPPDDITRGDAADALALQHFRAHVTPALL